MSIKEETAMGRSDLYPSLHWTEAYARRLGLIAADSEDCAATFVERQMTDNPQMSMPQLRVALRNHVRDFLRARRRRRRMEVDGAEAGDACWDAPDPQILPEGVVLQQECWLALVTVVARLQPVPRRLFVRRFLQDVPMERLALEFRRPPMAIRKTLNRACAQVRKSLERMGWSADDFANCLTGSQRQAPPHRGERGHDMTS